MSDDDLGTAIEVMKWNAATLRSAQRALLQKTDRALGDRADKAYKAARPQAFAEQFEAATATVLRPR